MRIALAYAVCALAFVVWVYAGWPQVFGFPPKPQAVEAANSPGDFLIRRNNNETTAVTGSDLDMTWDTEVDSNGSSATYSAGTFTLASGKYLVMWSERVDFDDTNTTNNQRGEVQGRLVVGGTATTTGAGQAYYRNGDNSCGSDCQWDGIVSGAGILEIESDSTSLVTRVYRTDSSTGAITSARVADWGGVSILALDDTWDYARYSIDTNTATVDAFSDIVWDTTIEEETGFSRSGANITITTAGQYLVTYSIPIQTNSGSDRTEYVSRITLDNTEVTGTRVSTYIRQTQSTEDGVLSYIGVIDVAASDVLTVELDATDGTIGSDNMLAGSSIQLVELPSGAETFIVEATATGNMNPTAVTEFAWETTAQIDTSAFTHTNPTDSFVEVDNDDDYLFFATQATDNGPSRSFSTGRFSVNDTISNYAVGGRYNRSSGADDGGYSVASLITGLSTGNDISLENIGIAQQTGSQTCDFCAMSGIRLSSLFGGGGGGGGGGLTLTGNVLFGGNLTITGAISKGSGTFAIDHPLDPENQILFHSFVESPDVKNVYDGIAELDESGEATIELPDYFMALNKDFRYQFLALDESQPDLYIKNEIIQNRFTIAGGAPNGRVSWQITGIRHDPYIEANPIINEVEKGEGALLEKGECLFEPLCE